MESSHLPAVSCLSMKFHFSVANFSSIPLEKISSISVKFTCGLLSLGISIVVVIAASVVVVLEGSCGVELIGSSEVELGGSSVVELGGSSVVDAASVAVVVGDDDPDSVDAGSTCTGGEESVDRASGATGDSLVVVETAEASLVRSSEEVVGAETVVVSLPVSSTCLLNLISWFNLLVASTYAVTIRISATLAIVTNLSLFGVSRC